MSSRSASTNQRAYLGIEIGGTKLQMVLGDDTGEILETVRDEVDREKGGEGIRRQIESKLPGVLSRYSLHGVGVGFGGPVDWRTGHVARSHQIEGWAGFDLCKWLHSFTEARVQVENDANAAALAEARHGAGIESDPVFYITMGSGIGGGLVVDNQIYHGASPGESEIGHVRLDREGSTVESRCSGWALDARIRALANSQPECLLATLCGEKKGGEARCLGPALAEGDSMAKQILDALAQDLAFALSHVVHLFHPEVIVLGGGLSLIGEPLRAAIAEGNRRHLMETFGSGTRIALASLGENVVPVGAMELARTLG